jgi:hypothetical protein
MNDDILKPVLRIWLMLNVYVMHKIELKNKMNYKCQKKLKIFCHLKIIQISLKKINQLNNKDYKLFMQLICSLADNFNLTSPYVDDLPS